jgi:hypothetical protein
MMGEVVGKAAYLCVLRQTTPRNIYESYLPDLIELLKQPGAMRRDQLSGDLYRDPSSPQVVPYLNKATDTVTGTLIASAQGATVQSLPGIVVDDNAAKLTGKWTVGAGLAPYVATGYRYAGAKESAEARYELAVPAAGKYELRLSWVGHENRATKASCTLERPGQRPLKLRLNQREDSSDPTAFHSLGQFDFAAGTAAVILSTEGADGFVHADAVQLLPR